MIFRRSTYMNGKVNTNARPQLVTSALHLERISPHTIRHWFETFRSGDESLEGEDRGTPPSLLNNDQLKAESHPRQTVKELKQHFGVDITISCRLNAIGEVKKLGKFIPLTAAAQPKGGFFGQHRDKRRKVDPLWQSSSLCTITRMRVLRR